MPGVLPFGPPGWKLVATRAYNITSGVNRYLAVAIQVAAPSELRPESYEVGMFQPPEAWVNRWSLWEYRIPPASSM